MPVTERVPATLARRRHARLLHPAGRTFAGEALIWGTPGPPTGVPLLGLPGRYPASVRRSKGCRPRAAAAGADEPRLVLAVGSGVGPWRPFGEVRLAGQRDARADTALAFDPIGNLPPGLRAVGPVARLRDRIHRGSRRARGASAQSGGSIGVTV
jgi:hypothetical protein